LGISIINATKITESMTRIPRICKVDVLDMAIPENRRKIFHPDVKKSLAFLFLIILLVYFKHATILLLKVPTGQVKTF
jgi:hypothetical protein